MSPSPLVSIVIVNWEGKEYLEKCLQSLYANTFQDFEIIFFDNGSTDGSVEFVQKNFPYIQCLTSPTNLGLAKACNQAFPNARGKYVFFLNNDIIADPHMLSELVKNAECNPKIGILGCKTVSYLGHDVLNAGVPMDLFGYSYGNGLPFYVDAAIFIRRELFEKLGGFDDRFLIYKEDVDLCWRTWLLGYEVKVIPTSWFHHDSFCATQNNTYSTSERKRFLSEAHTLCMLLKNYSLLTLCLILPVYFLTNIMEILLYGCFRGQWKKQFHIHRAVIGWNLKNLIQTLRLRKNVQQNRMISDWILFKYLKKSSGKFELLKTIGLPQIST